jgi:hypothetical protein
VCANISNSKADQSTQTEILNKRKKKKNAQRIERRKEGKRREHEITREAKGLSDLTTCTDAQCQIM